MKLPFGEFAPDVADLNSGSLALALNVFPGLKSYLPVPSLESISEPLTGSVRGMYNAVTASGDTVVFAGTATKLYKLSAGSWTDVTNTGGDYSLADGDYWQFEQFGDVLLAIAPGEDLQEIDIASGTNFADTAGSPPHGRSITVLNNQVVIGGLDSDPYGIAWSDIDDRTNWSTGNSGNQKFVEGGRVLYVSGAAKLVVQEKLLQSIIVTGSTEAELGVFNFAQITAARGALNTYGVLTYGLGVAYVSDEGIYLATQGEQKNIGNQKVNKDFFDRLYRNRAHQIQGAYDPLSTRFYWAFPTTDSDLNSHILAYDWSLDKWSLVEIGTYVLAATAQPGVGLDSLDGEFPSLDDMMISLDSALFQGGQPVFGAIGDGNELSYFQGPNMAARVDTCQYNLVEGRRAMVRGIVPHVDTSQMTCRVNRRQRLADANNWTAPSSMQASGNIPLRASGKYHQFRFDIAYGADWSHLQITDVDAVPEGVR